MRTLALLSVCLFSAFAADAPPPHIWWKFPAPTYNSTCKCKVQDVLANGKHVAKIEIYSDTETHLLLDRYQGKEFDAFNGKDAMGQAQLSLFRQHKFGDKPKPETHRSKP